MKIFDYIERFQIVDSINLLESLKIELFQNKKCNYDKFYETNFKKKLKSFTEQLVYDIMSIPKIMRDVKCNEFYKHILEILKSKGGNYFSHETVQILKNLSEDDQMFLTSLEGTYLFK